MASLRRRTHAARGDEPPYERFGDGKSDRAKQRTFGCCFSCLGITFLLLLSFALLLWVLPTPIDPVSFRYADGESPVFTGAMEVNDHLKLGRRLFENQILGPEGIALDGEGYIYTGLADGRVIRLDKDLESFTTVARTGSPPYDNCGTELTEQQCGRPLGMHFSKSNPHELYVADSSKGLLKVNVKSGQVETLFSTAVESQRQGGTPEIKFLNDLVVLDNGTIILTDSSKKFGRAENRLEALECRCNGQLLYFEPATGVIGVLRDGLYFPNGITLSNDGNSLLIVESTRARILRYHLNGPKAGTTDVFVDNLHGIPDNITPSLSGGYWVGIALVRTPFIDTLGEHLPLLRLAIAKLRLEALIQRLLPKHGLVVELDEDGRVVRSLHDVGGDITHSTSHITELEDSRLIIGSYHAPFLLEVRL